MDMIAKLLVGLVAVAHIAFLILEMFLWTTPYARKSFNMTPEFAEASAGLAANQGLYNGFLAAGLIWGLVAGAGGFEITVFFLACVIVAGLYGGATVKRSIFFLQAVPAILALAVVLLARKGA